MANNDADWTLRQLRTVARWWVDDARATLARQARDGDRYAQAAGVSRRQADDWHALADLLAAHMHPHRNPNLPRLVQAAERLADRLDPDWRNVTVEEVGDAS